MLGVQRESRGSPPARPPPHVLERASVPPMTQFPTKTQLPHGDLSESFRSQHGGGSPLQNQGLRFGVMGAEGGLLNAASSVVPREGGQCPEPAQHGTRDRNTESGQSWGLARPFNQRPPHNHCPPTIPRLGKVHRGKPVQHFLQSWPQARSTVCSGWFGDTFGMGRAGGRAQSGPHI